jgi:hypothetical protein
VTPVYLFGIANSVVTVTFTHVKVPHDRNNLGARGLGRRARERGTKRFLSIHTDWQRYASVVGRREIARGGCLRELR